MKQKKTHKGKVALGITGAVLGLGMLGSITDAPETEYETLETIPDTAVVSMEEETSVSLSHADMDAMFVPAPETEPVETAPPETEPVDTAPPETEPVETAPPETEPVETAPPETEPVETAPPETEPVDTTPPETEPVETAPPETEPQNTSIIVAITQTDSSMTQERIQELVGIAYYWASTGTKVHKSPHCSSLKEVIFAGTLEQANAIKDGGFCKKCKTQAQEANDIAMCYTYEDFMSLVGS